MLRTSSRLAAIGASALLLASPLVAAAADGNPVAVLSYSAADRGPHLDAFVDIGFENTQAVPATSVVFLVGDDTGHRAVVTDVGTFAKGVPIEQAFVAHGLGYEAAQRSHVQIVKVTYADGTAWQQPTPATNDPWWSL